MRPVAIFRHSPTEGAGHFATFLQRQGVDYELVRIDEGAAVPADARAFSGLALMGGPMSTNDPLPWIGPLQALIRAAAAAGIPLLGHCLGAQLMAKALGGAVVRNPVKEIGWGRVSVLDTPEARYWFGNMTGFLSFHWHGETFSLPRGATRILESPYCSNQAFALGPHLGLQCHVEMTEDMIRSWVASGAAEIARHSGPSIQTPAEIFTDMAIRVAALNGVADQLYRRWLTGLQD